MVNVVKEGVVQEGEVREGEIAKKDAEVEKARAEKRALEKRLQTVLNKLRAADDEIERLRDDLKVARRSWKGIEWWSLSGSWRKGKNGSWERRRAEEERRRWV